MLSVCKFAKILCLFVCACTCVQRVSTTSKEGCGRSGDSSHGLFIAFVLSLYPSPWLNTLKTDDRWVPLDYRLMFFIPCPFRRLCKYFIKAFFCDPLCVLGIFGLLLFSFLLGLLCLYSTCWSCILACELRTLWLWQVSLCLFVLCVKWAIMTAECVRGLIPAPPAILSYLLCNPLRGNLASHWVEDQRVR